MRNTIRNSVFALLVISLCSPAFSQNSQTATNRKLKKQLNRIYDDDQRVRRPLESIYQKYGLDSKEMKDQWALIRQVDSINLTHVRNILDNNGWLGPNAIGKKGNLALFLVIQHSNLTTQQIYLPMMREAVRNKNANPAHLALLEDRVALELGKRQIYGSQIHMDKVTQTYYVAPLEEPDHVDERRHSVGLEPLAEYVKEWKIKWDVEQYKKDLPAFEEKEKTK